MLSKTTIILMVVSAVFVDITVWVISLFHFIPLGITNIIVEIGTSAINLAATIVFFMWFLMKRIRFITPKKAVTMVSGAIIGITPIIGSLMPVWMMSISLTLFFHKKEQMQLKMIKIKNALEK